MSNYRMKTASILVACATISLVACKKQPEPAQSSPLIPSAGLAPAPPPAAMGSQVPPAALPIGITWEDPPSWQRLPGGNPMRKATYRPPRAAGDSEDPELAVFYFGPGQGGGIDANVDRWVKQFTEVKPDAIRREERQANGLRQHTVEIPSGTFNSGGMMPGSATQPKKGFAMLAGIVEAPSGVYFFKMTGPVASVKAARETFYKLLDSVKPSQVL
jgi:hypothetical protein